MQLLGDNMQSLKIQPINSVNSIVFSRQAPLHPRERAAQSPLITLTMGVLQCVFLFVSLIIF